MGAAHKNKEKISKDESKSEWVDAEDHVFCTEATIYISEANCFCVMCRYT